MNKRTAQLGAMKITSVTISSCCEIGDLNYFTPRSNAIAVQKQDTTFSDEGYEFEDYSIFQRQAARHIQPPLPVTQKTFHHVPRINVESVAILGVSTSSIMQVGGINEIDAEARVKHIRLLDDEQSNNFTI
ncbi:spore germination protein GerPE [Radiobacillus sp. PE A8.2]|uniref:spore germination protein GerPE n=1 Tax=Radiobacillus sp. PE A8.2 TaxID=3380349 RepID=UPI00388E64EE